MDADHVNAILTIDQDIGLEPQLAVLYANRAASNFCVKNFTSALQDATKCVQLDPTYARGWYIKGLCHFTFNEKKAACEALEAEAKIYCKTIERIRQQQRQLRHTPNWYTVCSPLLSLCIYAMLRHLSSRWTDAVLLNRFLMLCNLLYNRLF
eukprot:Protomagalhaensia_wolfi_Nauph_80__961@NODE_1555_length_1472_cov_14_939986_g1208_i0_p2_GENE_NODE_1555_length_1472_cov_14_939986_g1208_i0NODE_1555_length_1472_cov_14_939986_g1208_i0_p2_ORF_typecomplete_len152_score13_12TPR_9/PF13371_6/12TPR_9/PF13371_6/0_00018TPR_16/PF13432_6/9_5e03TPR_16/PF13432_6/2e05ANAPC3/PF12895_7/3_9e05TPR_11/PF13414_6/4_6TPR_11/PF13414_6/0_02ChAPs/PF09295_10/0_00016TPR_18/PF13512_6/0_0094TPR_2/PF07719_17/0_51TPR_2/PF07719_17/67Bunya_RdRp/PF04196_12/0_015TPR_1/PF00515_28/0_1